MGFSTTEDTAVTIDVMGNDFDPEGQPIQFASVDSTSAQGGTIVNNVNDVTYTPPPSNFVGKIGQQVQIVLWSTKFQTF